MCCMEYHKVNLNVKFSKKLGNNKFFQLCECSLEYRNMQLCVIPFCQVTFSSQLSYEQLVKKFFKKSGSSSIWNKIWVQLHFNLSLTILIDISKKSLLTSHISPAWNERSCPPSSSECPSFWRIEQQLNLVNRCFSHSKITPARFTFKLKKGIK